MATEGNTQGKGEKHGRGDADPGQELFRDQECGGVQQGVEAAHRQGQAAAQAGHRRREPHLLIPSRLWRATLAPK